MTGLLRLIAIAALAIGLANCARAQGDQPVFIQIEAQPNLTAAQSASRALSARFGNVAAFGLGSGWFAITLGPYTPPQAEAALIDLRGRGEIPFDSYIQDAARYGQQVWPLGASRTRTLAQVEGDAPLAAPPAAPDETPAEARRSESLLSRAEREEIQRALQWAGVYALGIDGAFGRGTRAGMRAWQTDNGYEATGVLTSRQRAELLEQYNAVFDGLGFARIEDDRTGIAIDMPQGVVAFDRIEAPFALYEPTTDLGARVLLISQPGDRASLGGLYEIMQTLEIVPTDGPRARQGDGFSITGRGDRIVSHTRATLRDGRIKGFTLIWPAGDEARRTRVLARMQDSFARIPGVLDPAQISDDAQAVDLVAGLRVRKPTSAASGFFVTDAGMVLTSAQAVDGCGRVTLDTVHEAEVIATEAPLGVAILRPDEAIAPRRTAQFRIDPARLQSDVAVAGYPFGGILGAPTLTYGRLADIQGLAGEETLKRLDLDAMPGDAGGPVLDEGGAVLGLLLPREEAGPRRLPPDVRFAAQADALMDILEGAGVSPVVRAAGTPIAPEDLTRMAAEMTVLVSCWE